MELIGADMIRSIMAVDLVMDTVTTVPITGITEAHGVLLHTMVDTTIL